MPEPALRDLSYGEALAEALDEVLAADPRITLIGASYGAHPAIAPVREKYASRLRWPPIAELAYCGVAIGAAMVGLRPLVDMGAATFSYEAIPQIVNEAGVAHALSAGAVTVPVLFHLLYGVRGAGAAQHSGSPQSWYWNAPGLQVVLPASPADVKGLFRWAALHSQNPTVLLTHHRLLSLRGPVPAGPLDIPFGSARVARAGSDVTIVACGVQVPRALAAADTLARDHGIQAEVVDPRTIQPLDTESILASVRKTGRVVVTDESVDHCGVAAGLAAIIADEAFPFLRAPVKRVSTLPVPVPYARPLEDHVTPLPARIVEAVLAIT